VSGQISVSGWTVDRKSTVRSLSIAVDGVVVGTAQYGIARPDVCSFYASPFNCPYVGWYFTLDTRWLSNGTHIVQAIENGSGGSALASRTVTVSNSSAPMQLCIDFPSPGRQYGGIAQFGGWAVNLSGTVRSVVVSVDGRPLGLANYGNSRPDVCNVFPGSGGCPNVGWSFSLDTTQLTNAPHILEITATSSSGQRATISNQFVASN